MFELLDKPPSPWSSLLRRVGIVVSGGAAAICLVMALDFRMDHAALTETQLFLDGSVLGYNVGAGIAGIVCMVLLKLEIEED